MGVWEWVWGVEVFLPTGVLEEGVGPSPASRGPKTHKAKKDHKNVRFLGVSLSETLPSSDLCCRRRQYLCFYVGWGPSGRATKNPGFWGSKGPLFRFFRGVPPFWGHFGPKNDRKTRKNTFFRISRHFWRVRMCPYMSFTLTPTRWGFEGVRWTKTWKS